MTKPASDRISFAGSVAAEGRRLMGSVVIAGQQTARNGEFVEVDLDALFDADRTGAVVVVGHQAFSEQGYDPLRTVARLDNDSLRITRTADGFDWETNELPNTTYANDALALAHAGVFGGTSFDIFGTRSTFRTDPGGGRIRRYTSIAKFGAVTPVVDPAFPSTVAAFSKETNVSEPTQTPEAPAPEAPPAKREPAKTEARETAERASFTQVNETKEATERFAKDLTTAQIETAMDAILAESGGDPTPTQLDRYEAFGKVLDERKKADSATRERVERMKALHDMRLGRLPKAPERASFAGSEEYREAFFGMGGYARSIGGVVNSARVEQFALSIAGDGSQGGFTVPDGFLAKIVERRKAYGGVESVAETITTETGNPIRWPTVDDTANEGQVVAEGAQPTNGADKVFGSTELGAYSYASNGANNQPIKVSWELLQDSAFDLEDFLARNLATRIGRAMAQDFATGTGAGEPLGLLTKSLDTMTATKTRAAAVEMEFQIDAAYRENAVWVMSDTTLAKYRNAVDLNGRPLWLPEAESGMTTRPGGILNGYRVVIEPAAGDLVAFGDINQGYIIRRVRGVQLLVNPYSSAATRQTEFHAWARADGTIQDSFAYSVSSFAGVTADATA